MTRALPSLLLTLTLRAQPALPIDTEVIKKSVVFLYATTPDGLPDLAKELSAGFLVEIPLSSAPGRSYRVLITARHVVDPTWACRPDPRPSALYARVNRKPRDVAEGASGVEFVKLLLENEGKSLWATHPSNTVDPAVIPQPAAESGVSLPCQFTTICPAVYNQSLAARAAEHNKLAHDLLTSRQSGLHAGDLANT